MRHRSTGSSVLELMDGLAVVALSAGAEFRVVRWVNRAFPSFTRWRLYARQIGFPTPPGHRIVLTVKAISRL